MITNDLTPFSVEYRSGLVRSLQADLALYGGVGGRVPWRDIHQGWYFSDVLEVGLRVLVVVGPDRLVR